MAKKTRIVSSSYWLTPKAILALGTFTSRIEAQQAIRQAAQQYPADVREALSTQQVQAVVNRMLRSFGGGR